MISPEGTGRHRQVNMGEENEDPDWLTAFQVPSRFGVSLLPYVAEYWTGGCCWGQLFALVSRNAACELLAN